MIRISKSQLQSFLYCPMQFKNLFEGKQMVANVGMNYGSEMHYSIEQFWKGIVIEGDKIMIPKLESNDNYMKGMFKNFKKMVNLRWEQLKQENKLESFVPKILEAKYEATVNVDGEEIRLVGVVDMIDSFGDENYLVEWKTGRTNPNYKNDLVFYSFLLKHCNINIKKGVIFYPSTGKIEIYDITEEDYMQLINLLRTIIFCIKHNNFYHNPNCNCDDIKWEEKNSV